MKIRPAVLEDAASIAHVHVASWRTAYAGIVSQAHLNSLDEAQFTERWQSWITSETSAMFCVAELDGALCGFASGGPIRKPISFYDGELYAIYLLPEMQRRGIGRALFASVAAALASRELKHMLLWTLRDNPSTGFYERLGGEIVAEDVHEIGGDKLAGVAYGWADIAAKDWN
ncbi:MAG TPA: GNAT family N-acetyltransferase [Silvibacterium sp.]|jgi:GNAT superfamily N-acetyltransferase|nr:GNAT family N-acetyltransferase [Silvibacterium sp.]